VGDGDADDELDCGLEVEEDEDGPVAVVAASVSNHKPTKRLTT